MCLQIIIFHAIMSKKYYHNTISWVQQMKLFMSLEIMSISEIFLDGIVALDSCEYEWDHISSDYSWDYFGNYFCELLYIERFFFEFFVRITPCRSEILFGQWGRWTSGTNPLGHTGVCVIKKWRILLVKQTQVWSHSTEKWSQVKPVVPYVDCNFCRYGCICKKLLDTPVQSISADTTAFVKISSETRVFVKKLVNKRHDSFDSTLRFSV